MTEIPVVTSSKDGVHITVNQSILDRFNHSKIIGINQLLHQASNLGGLENIDGDGYTFIVDPRRPYETWYFDLESQSRDPGICIATFTRLEEGGKTKRVLRRAESYWRNEDLGQKYAIYMVGVGSPKVHDAVIIYHGATQLYETRLQKVGILSTNIWFDIEGLPTKRFEDTYDFSFCGIRQSAHINWARDVKEYREKRKNGQISFGGL